MDISISSKNGSDLGNWLSPANWTSIQNDNPNFGLEYWAYNNEFVRNATTINTEILRRPQGGEQIMMFRTGIPNPPVDDPGVVVYRGQCNTDLPNVFPLRMAVDPLGNSAVTSFLDLLIGTGLKAILGDAIPNPASSKVAIPVFIPEQSGNNFVLSIFDLSGKSLFEEISITEKGKAMVEIPVHHLPAGIYGFSLREGGKVLGTRKLVLIK